MRKKIKNRVKALKKIGNLIKVSLLLILSLLVELWLVNSSYSLVKLAKKLI